MAWFVRPETVRLDLPDGEWVEVKAELSWGEQQKMIGAGIGFDGDLGSLQSGTGKMSLQWVEFQVENLLLWIVDWSATDAQGKPVPVSKQALLNLHPKMTRMLEDAIGEHKAKLEKNLPATTD